MRIGFIENHKTNKEGNPTGGASVGTGFTIAWQDGPLGRDGDRIEPNGAFVEDVLDAVKGRIEFYEKANNGKFSCQTNKDALAHIVLALEALDSRTKERESRGVEGTHKV